MPDVTFRGKPLGYDLSFVKDPTKLHVPANDREPLCGSLSPVLGAVTEALVFACATVGVRIISRYSEEAVYTRTTLLADLGFFFLTRPSCEDREKVEGRAFTLSEIRDHYGLVVFGDLALDDKEFEALCLGFMEKQGLSVSPSQFHAMWEQAEVLYDQAARLGKTGGWEKIPKDDPYVSPLQHLSPPEQVTVPLPSTFEGPAAPSMLEGDWKAGLLKTGAGDPEPHA